ncbi:lipopolysaccharide biosynthesis protein [Ruminococcus flavefaciens]|uniref:Uncharacterized protein n=1 Tax=Ruminococcus flavefaciens 007c TaxID=1341157 RepID=W7URL5_RUMFL|nr:polysaccharide biosynthesis C-terminal domain-containing protein [Ruminococcus flavefaciens]EWM54089.1 hypothetical protein RF007C_00670 [Ruminococcus flavefaciens 007c]
MDKYKKLAFNTVIFAAGSFGSKIFSLLLNNLYTKHISPSGIYTKTMLETLALFLLPVFTFSLTEAIIRYGLDNRYKKKQVFSTSAVIMLAGLAAMILFVPLLHLIPVLRRITGYSALLYIYVCTSSLRALCSQFVRARNMVKLFSLDGIFATMTLFLFNIVFISKLGMDVKGFMISMILSDTCSALFLFIAAGLGKFADIKSFSAPLGKSMLKFTLPLIPTTIIWTFTGFSDQLFVGNMHSDKVFLGDDAAGIYSAATKIPNLLSMLSTIFYQAWNMSAITENDSAGRDRFYTRVYSAYESVLFIGAAVLILLIKPVSAILINYSTFPEYSTAYIYTPLLITAAVFTCLNLFLSGIYTATKHTKNAFYSILAVALTNIVLNLRLIPVCGIQGAAFATFLSYLLCYCIRIIDARYFVPFDFSVIRTVLNTVLLLLMCIPVIFSFRGCLYWEILLTAAICALNYSSIADTALKLLKKERA